MAFRTAACDGIAYENSAFSPEARNWLHRPELAGHRSGVPYPCQWCHGAAGIGLARIGALGALDDRAIRADIDAAIQTTIEVPIVAMDHLCCGNFGRIEFLFTAGRRLGRDDLVGLALDRAAQLVARAHEAGTFKWGLATERHSPGFFTSMAGVGYELLRLTHPEVLPSLLLWE
jgi:lantibiotic modifying enzyme